MPVHPTELFVYGTLRHDQPEHAKFCRGVTSWKPARMWGHLWMLPAGYRIISIPPIANLLAATTDARADEDNRGRITRDALRAAVDAGNRTEPDGRWIEGELLSFASAEAAWPPLDGWEEFSPGRPGCYARVVVPVEVVGGSEPEWRAAWAYVSLEPPLGGTRIPG